MSQFDDKVALYEEKLAEHGMTITPGLLARAAKACGPSLYNADAETVAASDPTELETVKKNFVMGKLGIEDEAAAESAVAEVAEEMAVFGSRKFRAVFYARLAMKLGKEEVLGGDAE